MGIFGKKEQTDERISEKSEEVVLKEALETEVIDLQKEFRAKHEEIENITKKIQSVKEEYDIATSNLMSVKKESNQKKMELDTTYLEYKDIRSKINNIDETRDKRETKGIIEAASVVVGSLKSKLSMAEKEIETVQTLLEKERNEHIQTKNELEKLKRKINSN